MICHKWTQEPSIALGCTPKPTLSKGYFSLIKFWLSQNHRRYIDLPQSGMNKIVPSPTLKKESQKQMRPLLSH